MEISELEHDETNKYLGIYEVNGIIQNNFKFEQYHRKIFFKFYRKIRAIVRTKLKSKNKVIVINTKTIPVVRDSFNLIK